MNTDASTNASSRHAVAWTSAVLILLPLLYLLTYAPIVQYSMIHKIQTRAVLAYGKPYYYVRNHSSPLLNVMDSYFDGWTTITGYDARRHRFP